jgi:hypothetical protein
MKQTLDVLNGLEADGVIRRYAIAGAVAAYNYIEPTLTEDLDVLISFGDTPGAAETGLITLTPILSYLRDKGYAEHQREGVVIAGWPVQFLPVANGLDAEALAQAQDLEVRIADAGVKTRVLRPEHLVAIAVRVGRPKDLIRITQFLEDNAVDAKALRTVLSRHQLTERWSAFCRRTGIADPCAL